MKLIVLFVGLCVSVGVLCSVTDQDEDGLTISSRSGDMLAPSYNRTLTRNKRVIGIPLLFLGVLVIGGVGVAVQNSMINDIDLKHKLKVPPSSLPGPLVLVNTLVNYYNKEFNSNNGLCSPKLNRRKRQPNPQNSNCPQASSTSAAAGQPYYNEIEIIAAALRNHPSYITTDLSNDNTHAVLNYTTITTPAIGNHPQPADLVVTMQARLTYDNSQQYTRAQILANADVITNHMRELDWYQQGNRNTNDERGHLLADSLGGPSATWNFVPQSPSVNRAVTIGGDNSVTYCWFDLEDYIREVLRENQDHYIVWTILVGYGGLPTWRRPTGFMISVRLMRPNHEFRNYRQFMIPNVPSDACNNPNHQYWHLQ